MSRPACRDYDPNWWHSDHRAEQAEAVRICNTCPLRVPCLTVALERETTARTGRWGIWGGLTPDERHRLVTA